MIFWYKIVIFHTKYPKKIHAFLRSCNFFKYAAPVMVNILALSVVEYRFEHVMGQIKNLSNWCLLLLCQACSITEQEQRLVDSESDVEWSNMDCCFSELAL